MEEAFSNREIEAKVDDVKSFGTTFRSVTAQRWFPLSYCAIHRPIAEERRVIF